jgi:hypothetical protein
MSRAAAHRALARLGESVVPDAKLKNRLVAGGVAREVRGWKKPAITRRLGSNWRISLQSGSGRKRGIDGEET